MSFSLNSHISKLGLRIVLPFSQLGASYWMKPESTQEVAQAGYSSVSGIEIAALTNLVDRNATITLSFWAG
ncbi:MAG: hypothetical protein WB556_00280 [Candidatus Acidiferrum sp.]